MVSKLNEQIRDHSINNELNSELNNKYKSVISENEQLKSQIKDKDVQIQKLEHQLKFSLVKNMCICGNKIILWKVQIIRQQILILQR